MFDIIIQFYDMDKQYKKLKKRWLLQGGLGLSLLGFGLCFVIEVAFLKHEGASFWIWVGLGALALVIFNLGAALAIDALKFKIKMEAIKR